jgi:hypothetical protein
MANWCDAGKQYEDRNGCDTQGGAMPPDDTGAARLPVF